MSDDLIKRLGESVWTLDQAADRIEQLEAKLSKAVDALQFQNQLGEGLSTYARTVLAELEGKE